MAVFRQVQPKFWQDDFVLNLTPKQKLFYMWLLTNPKTNQSGCYEISSPLARFETGLIKDELKDELQDCLDFFARENKIKYDAKTGEVLILNWLKYNGSSSPKVLQNINENIKNIKNLEFKQYCMDTLSILYGYSTDIHTQKEKEEEKEETKEKEKQQTKNKVFLEFACGHDDLLFAFGEFEEMRKKLKKPLTQEASKRLCNKLNELAHENRQRQTAIINQSCDKCWLGFFELSTKNTKGNNGFAANQFERLKEKYGTS